MPCLCAFHTLCFDSRSRLLFVATALLLLSITNTVYRCGYRLCSRKEPFRSIAQRRLVRFRADAIRPCEIRRKDFNVLPESIQAACYDRSAQNVFHLAPDKSLHQNARVCHLSTPEPLLPAPVLIFCPCICIFFEPMFFFSRK